MSSTGIHPMGWLGRTVPHSRNIPGFHIASVTRQQCIGLVLLPDRLWSGGLYHDDHRCHDTQHMFFHSGQEQTQGHLPPAGAPAASAPTEPAQWTSGCGASECRRGWPEGPKPPAAHGTPGSQQPQISGRRHRLAANFGWGIYILVMTGRYFNYWHMRLYIGITYLPSVNIIYHECICVLFYGKLRCLLCQIHSGCFGLVHTKSEYIMTVLNIEFGVVARRTKWHVYLQQKHGGDKRVWGL